MDKGGSSTLGNGRNGGSGKLAIVWLVGMVGVVSSVLMHVYLYKDFKCCLNVNVWFHPLFWVHVVNGNIAKATF